MMDIEERQPCAIPPTTRTPRFMDVGLWTALAMFGVMPPAAAMDRAECYKETLSREALRDCSSLMSKKELTAAERSRVYTLRGAAWMREEEPMAAISDFSRAIRINSDDLAALKGRAQAYASMKNYDMALSDWSRIIAVQPNLEESFIERAKINVAARDIPAALADYDHVIKLNPKNPDAYIGKARIYGQLKRHDDALLEFDKAIKVNPDYPALYLARGEVFETLGDRKIAIESYQAVLKYEEAYWYAIRALQRLGGDWATHR